MHKKIQVDSFNFDAIEVQPWEKLNLCTANWLLNSKDNKIEYNIYRYISRFNSTKNIKKIFQFCQGKL